MTLSEDRTKPPSIRNLNAADRRRSALRDQLWPGSSGKIWDMKDREAVKGFASVPRLLPWVLHLIKHLAKEIAGGDPSMSYLELWCRDFGQGIITISDEHECAFASGYSGKRAVRTWREHMFKLLEIGFILAEAVGNREYGYVLLLNPLAVCHRLHLEKKAPDGWWAAFVSRATAIGATIPPPLNAARS